MYIKVAEASLVNKRSNDPPVQKKNEPSASESSIYRWIGLKDLLDARIFYQRNEYRSALKSAAVAYFKLGTIATACYGVYKWATGNQVVHINQFFTQAQEDFLKFKEQPIVPQSVETLIDSMYKEQPVFDKWMTGSKEFFSQHLSLNHPMSRAVVKYLLEQAALKRDFTFEKYAIKTCKQASSSSKSCMATAEFYMGASNPRALKHAMRLVNECRTARNEFCEKAFERAKDLSLAEKSFPYIDSLSKKLTELNAKLEKSKIYIEKAAALFEEKMGEIERAIEDCKKAKERDPAAGALCYKSANGFEKTGAWASWGMGKWEEWKRAYAPKQERALQIELHDALPGCVDFAKVCSKIAPSEGCSRYVETMVSLFRMHTQYLEKEIEDCSQVDVGNIDSWNRCFAHASFWERTTGLNHQQDAIWQENYVKKKRENLKKPVHNAVSFGGIHLAHVCANFSQVPSCQGFAEEIIQKLVDFDMSGEALKLLLFIKESIGPLVENLTNQKKWRQGVAVILAYAKRNNPLDIENHIVSFSNQLMTSNEAFRGFELLPLTLQLDIEKTIEAAFGNVEEDHLHRVYLLAKSWIAKYDKKYEKSMKFIIRKFFESENIFFGEMAKSLVTKWIETIQPDSIDFSSFLWPPLLNQKPMSRWDRYSSSINRANWEQTLSRAGL